MSPGFDPTNGLESIYPRRWFTHFVVRKLSERSLENRKRLTAMEEMFFYWSINRWIYVQIILWKHNRTKISTCSFGKRGASLSCIRCKFWVSAHRCWRRQNVAKSCSHYRRKWSKNTDHIGEGKGFRIMITESLMTWILKDLFKILKDNEKLTRAHHGIWEWKFWKFTRLSLIYG